MFGIERNLRGKPPFRAEPHVPVDVIISGLLGSRGLVYLEPAVECAVADIAVIASLSHCDLPHPAVAYLFLSLPVLVFRGALGTDLKDFIIFLDRVTD